MSAYRDDLQAAHLRVESLQTELEDEQQRAESLQGELEEARQEKFVDLEGLVARVHRLEAEVEVLRGDPASARKQALQDATRPLPAGAVPRKASIVGPVIIVGLGALAIAVGLATLLWLRPSPSAPAPSPKLVVPPAPTEQVEQMPAPATRPLEQADVMKVVAEKVSSLKRQCWEPALAARSSTAPSSVKVSVMVTIGADGAVQNAVASGGVGYPDLSNCIAVRIRTWKFPASSGSSTANIPLTFASQ